MFTPKLVHHVSYSLFHPRYDIITHFTACGAGLGRARGVREGRLRKLVAGNYPFNDWLDGKLSGDKREIVLEGRQSSIIGECDEQWFCHRSFYQPPVKDQQFVNILKAIFKPEAVPGFPRPENQLLIDVNYWQAHRYRFYLSNGKLSSIYKL